MSEEGTLVAGWEHSVAFLPWLVLSAPVTVYGVRFVPFATATREHPAPELTDMAPLLRQVLKGYVDRRGRPIRHCTVACQPDAKLPWHIPDEREEAVSEAVTLLAFVGLAGNSYFSGSGGAYTNATAFDAYFQRLSAASQTIAVETRQRDGRLLSGGYAHGDLKFSIPVQCASLRPPATDHALVAALDKAQAGGSVVLRRLLPALSFVLLANTDASAVLPSAEVILLASAFEQLLDARGAFPVSEAFAKLIAPFGSVRVRDAMTARRGITLKTAHAPAQEGWFVHQKWLEEFHNLRSAYVHGNDLSKHAWGWRPLEHLVMAMFSFPILVKLLLAAEGHYSLTDIDQDRCRALDRLLAAPDWASTATSGATTWEDIVSSVTRNREAEAREVVLKARLTALRSEE